MKKTFSMIYRFVFIFFSVWGICQKVGFNFLTLTARILDFTLLVDFLCFVCIAAVFIINITHKPGRIVGIIKTSLTLCSALVLIVNFGIIAAGLTSDWILGILLSVMMLLDWVLFDEKGRIKLYDPLIWLGAPLLLLGSLALVLKELFGIDDVWNVLGMFNDLDGFLKLLLKSLGIGVVLYVIDCIGSEFASRKFNNAFVVIYRLLFLALELYAFVVTIGREMTDFLYSLRYYHILSNFLCAVCIAVLVIYNLVRFKSVKRSATPFPALKAAFTICILVTMGVHILFTGHLYNMSFSKIILYYVAPLMMLFDWVLFDKKGSFRIYDPLLWLLIPFAYFAVAVTYLIPYTEVYYKIFTLRQPQMFVVTGGIILVGGYIYYIADKLLSRK